MDNELRDKLVELFAVTSLEFEDAVVLANYLIQNGVTIPVRCEDCKHWCEDTLSCMCGNHYDDNWYGEDFCSYGERKDNG